MKFIFLLIYINFASDPGKFCGKKPPKRPLRPSGHKVFVKFKSDDSTTGRGFKLEWSAKKLEVKEKGSQSILVLFA